MNGSEGGGGDGGSSTEFSSTQPPGASAGAFIDGDPFSTLRLEVDYMPGHAPTHAGLDSLRAELDEHLDKSTIVIEMPTEIPSGGQSEYTSDDVREIENQHRDNYTQGGESTLWAYCVILDGTFATQNVVGIAYLNTSMAFFGETIDEISGGLTQPSPSKVEGTAFRHEFGHNLGLVNNGTPMQDDHQDDPNGAHCTNDACVMLYAIETTDFFANTFDGTIPQFEPFCTDDIVAQGGRR